MFSALGQQLPVERGQRAEQEVGGGHLAPQSTDENDSDEILKKSLLLAKTPFGAVPKPMC
jgi:hypothetical protein